MKKQHKPMPVAKRAKLARQLTNNAARIAQRRRCALTRTSGEAHPRTYLSDEDCELMRQLHEDYDLTIEQIAAKFDAPWSTVRDIVGYRTRTQLATA